MHKIGRLRLRLEEKWPWGKKTVKEHENFPIHFFAGKVKDIFPHNQYSLYRTTNLCYSD